MYHFLRGLTSGFHPRRYPEVPTNKPKFHLENLPFDVIIDVLSSSNSFADLHALITTSAVCYRLFKKYQNSVLTQVARNTIGPDEDTWKDATTILTYQRKANYHPTKYLPDFATMNFVLQREDIRHLIANVKLFEAVAETFVKYVNSHYPLAKNPKRTDRPLQAGLSAFTAGDTLSMKMFFRQWVLSLQFAYDPISTFAKHKPLTVRELIDIQVVSAVIRRTPGFKRFAINPLWGRRCSLLSYAATKRISCHKHRCWPFSQKNYMLWAKIMYHYDFILWKDGWQGVTINEYDSLMASFCDDLAVFELEPLIERYKLSCGWD